MGQSITSRDVEILRTLLRLQLVNTTSLQEIFFPQLRVARRRLSILRDRGLIAMHGKGLPGPMASGARYWRLTRRGVETVAHVLPTEPIPNHHVERVAKMSLRAFEHRDMINAVYLGVVGDWDHEISEVRRRASSFQWFSEYDVELTYNKIDGAAALPRRIIPDAAVLGNGVRYFLEIDRSTESRRRCQRKVEAYQASADQGGYNAAFPDGLPFEVIFIARTDRRAAGLTHVVDQMRATIPCRALPFDKAVCLLGALLCGGEVDDAPPDCAATLLRDVYEVARVEIQRRHTEGEPVETPSCLEKAYRFLAAMEASGAA